MAKSPVPVPLTSEREGLLLGCARVYAEFFGRVKNSRNEIKKRTSWPDAGRCRMFNTLPHPVHTLPHTTWYSYGLSLYIYTYIYQAFTPCTSFSVQSTVPRVPPSFLFLSFPLSARVSVILEKEFSQINEKNNQINIRYVMYRDLTNVSLLSFFCLPVVLGMSSYALWRLPCLQ
jgi:hypothetical protein